MIGDTSDLYADEAERCRRRGAELGVADRLHLLGHVSTAELRDAYRGWIILRHEEGLIPCAQDGVRHVHSVETLLAERP